MPRFTVENPAKFKADIIRALGKEPTKARLRFLAARAYLLAINVLDEDLVRLIEERDPGIRNHYEWYMKKIRG